MFVRMYLLTAVMLLAAPLAFAQSETTPAIKPDATTLSISADARLSAEPDIANVSAGVVTQATTAAAALKDNAQKMAAVFAALKKAGVASKDIQTSSLSLNPQYKYEENKAPVVTGYQAMNTVNVTIRDLKGFGPIIDALVAQGANQVNGPSFSIENSDKLMDQARTQAVKKAQDRAKLYADATGLTVKRIVSISENGGMAPPPMPYPVMAMRAKSEMASDAGAPSPTAAGEVDITAHVHIVYELGQ